MRPGLDLQMTVDTSAPSAPEGFPADVRIASGRKPRKGLGWRWLAIVGPGLLVMLADTDAGSIITAAQSGAQWGYRLLALQILLIPILYMVQELTLPRPGLRPRPWGADPRHLRTRLGLVLGQHP